MITGTPGLRRLHLRHDRLQRQPAAPAPRIRRTRSQLWGLSLAGLQLWNSIRASTSSSRCPTWTRRDRRDRRVGRRHADVPARRRRRPHRGRRAGQHDLAAHAGRLPVREPARPAPRHEQREMAAMIAPRPLLMVSATGDWTKETMELEYPEMQKFYAPARRRGSCPRRPGARSTTTTGRAASTSTRGWRAGSKRRRPSPGPGEVVPGGTPLGRPRLTAGRCRASRTPRSSRKLDCGGEAADGDAERPLLRAELLHALGIEAREPLVPQLGAERRSSLPRTILRCSASSARLVSSEAGQLTPFDAAAA